MIPKFRVWDKIDKRWDNEYHIASDGEICMPWDAAADEPSRLEVSLSTGLTDKNGKEIFEGDILQFDDGVIEGRQTEFGRTEVCFGDYDDSEMDYGSPAFGWYISGYYGYHRVSGKSDSYDSEESILTLSEKYEIIGNRYENPELLEEEP